MFQINDFLLCSYLHFFSEFSILIMSRYIRKNLLECSSFARILQLQQIRVSFPIARLHIILPSSSILKLQKISLSFALKLIQPWPQWFWKYPMLIPCLFRKWHLEIYMFMKLSVLSLNPKFIAKLISNKVTFMCKCNLVVINVACSTCNGY